MRDENPDEAELFFEKQTAFLNDHIGAWVIDFSEQMEFHAETGFYKNLAKVCKRFIAEEMSDLSNQSACVISCNEGFNVETGLLNETI